MTIPLITQPEAEMLPLVGYAKPVRAALVDEPFVLRTSVGDVCCEGGYVVFSADGELCCIEKRRFESEYVIADSSIGSATKSVTVNPDG